MYVNVRIVGFDEIALHMATATCEGHDETRAAPKLEEEEGISLHEMAQRFAAAQIRVSSN